MRRPGRRALSAPLLVALALLFALASAAARAEDPQDALLRQVGVDERPGARIPLGLPFKDAAGNAVLLGDYFKGGPVILTLNYYTCPMLCPLTFRSLAATMTELKGMSLSKDYRVVTVSINAEELPEIARVKANETHALMRGLERGDDRWPFLYGGAESIRRLTESVGYRYQKVGSEFAHPAVAIVLTPEGVVSRYLYGIEIPALDLKLALIEAADGKIGASSAANTLLMYCFRYDPVGKKYALVAMNIMKLAGAITVAFLAALFVALHLWRGRKEAGRGTGE
jgi:protein SCO1/2